MVMTIFLYSLKTGQEERYSRVDFRFLTFAVYIECVIFVMLMLMETVDIVCECFCLWWYYEDNH